MPTYTYKCTCEHEQEVGHSMHDQPEVLCPKCGKAMRKLPQVSRVEFKGKGWASLDG